MDVNATLLLVEDNDDDATLLIRALQKAKIPNPVVRVKNGEEAISYLLGKEPFEDRTKFPYPGLIVTDLKMPVKNGMELLSWLYANRAFQVIPTIVLSSGADQREIRHCYALGANAYFAKPYKPGELHHLVTVVHEFWSLAKVPLP